MTIEQSLETLCQKVSAHWQTQHGDTAWKLDYSLGRKYHRLFTEHTTQRSCYAFIDNDGNVYKSASWKAPAKGIRFHIDQLLEHPQLCDMFGSFLYRR